MAFDIEGARKAGYSSAEIADHLAQQSKFDAASARTSGYSDDEIVAHLSQAPAKPAEKPGLVDRFVSAVTPDSGTATGTITGAALRHAANTVKTALTPAPSVADRAVALSNSDQAAPQVPGVPVRQGYYNNVLAQTNAADLSAQDEPAGIAQRVRVVAANDQQGQSEKQAVHDAVTSRAPVNPDFMQDRTAGQFALDQAAGVVQGGANAVKGMSWLAGKAGLDGDVNDSIMYGAKSVADDMEKSKSEQSRAISEYIGNQTGFWNTLSKAVENPAYIADTISENALLMLPGMGLAAGAGRVGRVALATKTAQAALAKVGMDAAVRLSAGGATLPAITAGIKAAQAKAASSIVGGFATAGAILGEGLTSAGITGSDVQDFVSGQKFADLEKNNPRFVELSKSMPKARARAQLADELSSDAAMKAGAWTALVAGATGAGAFMGKVAAGTERFTVKQAVKDMAKETLDETLQNPGEEYAAYAAKRQVDPSQSFDIGSSAAQGAIGGFGQSAGMNAMHAASTGLSAYQENRNGEVAPLQIVAPPSVPPGAIRADAPGAEGILAEGQIPVARPETTSEAVTRIINAGKIRAQQIATGVHLQGEQNAPLSQPGASDNNIPAGALDVQQGTALNAGSNAIAGNGVDLVRSGMAAAEPGSTDGAQNNAVRSGVSIAADVSTAAPATPVSDGGSGAVNILITQEDKLFSAIDNLRNGFLIAQQEYEETGDSKTLPRVKKNFRAIFSQLLSRSDVAALEQHWFEDGNLAGGDIAGNEYVDAAISNLHANQQPTKEPINAQAPQAVQSQTQQSAQEPAQVAQQPAISTEIPQKAELASTSEAIKPLINQLTNFKKTVDEIKYSTGVSVKSFTALIDKAKNGTGRASDFTKAAKQFEGKDEQIYAALTNLASAIERAKTSAPKQQKSAPLTAEERARRAPVLARAKELGINTVARKFSEIEKDVLRGAEIRHEKAVKALSDAEYQQMDDHATDLMDMVAGDNEEAQAKLHAVVQALQQQYKGREYFEKLTAHLERVLNEQAKPATAEAQPEATGSGESGAGDHTWTGRTEDAHAAGQNTQAAVDASDERLSFIKAPDGSIDFGEITPDMAKSMRRQPGNIRLNNGVQNKDGTGYGLVHIEARHGKEIRSAGFGSVEEFILDAVKHIDAIWMPGTTSQIVAVQADDKGKVMFLELQQLSDKSGEYYRVNSAFPAGEDYVTRKEKREGWRTLWSRYPVPADASGASGFANSTLDAGKSVPTVSPQSGSNTVLQPAAESKPTQEQPAEAKVQGILAIHNDVMDRAREGRISADEFKAAFDALLNNKEGIVAELEAMTKQEIFKRFPGLAYRYKNEKKDRLIDAAYYGMMDSFVLSDSISYSMSQKYEDVIRGYVERTTDESLAEYANKVRKSQEERAARREEDLAGMDDPQTLEDYQRIMAANVQEIGEGATFAQARMAMQPEQRAKFDELAAEKSRSERASRKEAQYEQSIRALGEAVETTEIIKTKHTKHGHDLWQFNLVQRVSSEEFKTLAGQAKRLGGDYSSYRGNGAIPGWQFRTEEAAKAFKALVAGDTAQAKDVMGARRDAFSDDRSQSAVERLTEMADALEEKADSSLNQARKENTNRRAEMAARAETAARSDKALAQTMRNIAQAIQDGSAKFLDRIRQKVQVETLRGFAHTAQADMLRQKYPTYAEQEKHRDAPITADAADYATYPTYTAFRSDLANIGRALLEVDGTKKLGQRIMKVADDVSDAYLSFAKENLHKVSTFSKAGGGGAVFASKAEAEAVIARSGFNGKAIVLPFKRGQNIIIQSPSEAIKRGIWQGDHDKRITLHPDIGAELVEKMGKAARRGVKISVPWQLENAYDMRKRLAGMNIETPAELRSALREFIGLREAPREADKIKQLERAMIGRRNDGMDFFPTPASVADEMVRAADIQEGMSVLEPSAGMGHIADRIREAGVEPDVVELAVDRRELLEAKGYNLVGNDFMDTDGKYDRILMNPPFGDRRDAEHVQHAYDMLKPGGRLVAIMGEGVFFGSDSKAQAFRNWLDQVGGTSEKLAEGTFLDPSLPVNTGVAARMVVVTKETDKGVALYSQSATPVRNPLTLAGLKAAINSAFSHVKDFAGLLEGTGKVLFISRDEIGKYLGEGAKFSVADNRKMSEQAIGEGKKVLYVNEEKRQQFVQTTRLQLPLSPSELADVEYKIFSLDDLVKFESQSNPDIRYSADSSRILAFVRDGITHFVYDNISETGDNIEGLVKHEIAVHALELGKSDKEFIAIQEQVNAMRKMGNQKVVAAFETASRALGLSSILPSKGVAQSISRNAYSQSDILGAQTGINKLLDKIEVVLGAPIGNNAKSAFNENIANTGRPIAKHLSDLIVRTPSITKRLGALDIDTQVSVLSSMRSIVHNSEVFNSIVEFIPIDMMNVLVSGELASDAALHDMAVFIDVPSADWNNPITAFIDVAGRLAQTMAMAHGARLRAEADGRIDRLASISKNLNSAERASTINNRHDVTPLSDVGLGIVTGETVTLPPIVSRHTLFHEVIGYFVQSNTDVPLTKQFVAWFRAQLRKLGENLKDMNKLRWVQWANKIQDSDIIYMAAQTMRSAPQTLAQAEARGTFKAESSEKARFIDEISKWFTLPQILRNRGNALIVGRTPDALMRVGAEQHDITIDRGTLIKLVRKHGDDPKGHGITQEQLNALPDAINNPIAIFESSPIKGVRRKNGRVVLTEMFDADGEQIVVAIHLSKAAGRGHVINDISSVHGRKNEEIGRWVDSGLTLYFNDTRNETGSEWLTTGRLELPAVVQAAQSLGNTLLLKSWIVKSEAKFSKRQASIPGTEQPPAQPPVEFDGTELGGKSQPIAQLVLKAREFARRMFSDKTVIATDGHEILIPWSGIKHTFSGKVSANAAIVASKLDKVIESGVLVKSEADKEGRNTIKAVHTYETHVTVAGEPVTIHVIVREALDGKRFYDHYEADVEAAGGMSGERIGTDSIQPTPATLPNVPGKDNVLQSTGTVNAARQANIPGAAQSRLTLPEETALRKTQRIAQDQQIRWDVVQNAIKEQGGIVNSDNDVFLALKLYSGRVAAAFDAFQRQVLEPLLERAANANIHTDEIAEYLYAQHAPERNAQIAKINPRFPDGGSGMTDADAAQIMDEYRARKDFKTLKALADEFRGITDRTLTMLVSFGVFSQEHVDAYRNTYQYYVPLKGFEQVDEDVKQLPGTGLGHSTSRSIGKRAKGRGSRAGQIIENIIRDHEIAIIAAEKANIGRRVRKFVEDNPDDALWTVEQEPLQAVLTKGKTQTVTEYEIIYHGSVVEVRRNRKDANDVAELLNLKDPGSTTVNPVQTQTQAAHPNGLVSMRAMTFDAEKEIQFIENDKAVRIQLHDPLLVRAYNKLGMDGMGKLFEVSATFNSFLRQMYTQKNPVFFLINPMRDVQGLLVSLTGYAGSKVMANAFKHWPGAWLALQRYSLQEKHSTGHNGALSSVVGAVVGGIAGGVPGAAIGAAIGSTIARSESALFGTDAKAWQPWIDQYKANGGAVGFAWVGDIQQKQERIDHLLERLGGVGVMEAMQRGEYKKGVKRMLFRVLNNEIFDMIEHLNYAFENASRLAAFRASVEGGINPREAARIAKNVTTNFNDKGEIGGEVNALYLFANASIQGTAEVARVLSGNLSKNKGKAWAIVGAIVTMGFVAGMGDDDDDKDLVPDHEKQRFWRIDLDNGRRITLPKPYGWAFFYDLGRAMAYTWKDSSSKSVQKQSLAVASSFLGNFSPINVMPEGEMDVKNVLVGAAPTALRPLAQSATNRTSFGSPLMPESERKQNQPDSEKAWRKTRGGVYDALAKGMNKATGGDVATSGTVDVSPETLKMIASFLAGGAGRFTSDTVSSALEFSNDGEVEAAKMPIVRQFYRENDVDSYLRRFYAQKEEAEKQTERFATYSKNRDLAGIKKLRSEDGAMLKAGYAAPGIGGAIAELRNQEETITANAELSRAEKKRRVEAIDKKVIGLTKRFDDMHKKAGLSDAKR